eukprot:14388301-Ditylum_brightwellii.AAC.1
MSLFQCIKLHVLPHAVAKYTVSSKEKQIIISSDKSIEDNSMAFGWKMVSDYGERASGVCQSSIWTSSFRAE